MKSQSSLPRQAIEEEMPGCADEYRFDAERLSYAKVSTGAKFKEQDAHLVITSGDP